MRTLSIRTLLESRFPLLGVNIMYPSVGALERIGAEWDWVWIEHGQLSYDSQLAGEGLRSGGLPGAGAGRVA